MNYKFLVTTDVNRVNEIAIGCQIVMVDGTVPGWIPRDKDLHFDHHRLNGAETQIDEISEDINYMLDENACFVTTQVDADACVAACWLIGLASFKKETIREKRKLQAIAYDCDHLVVPDHLSEYEYFATKAVAALKSNSDKLITLLNLPADRKTWSKENKELYASKAFEQGVIDLSKAVQGNLLYPGENGEADSYIEKLNETF